MLHSSLLSSAMLVSTAVAASRTNAPADAISVCSSCSYKTIQSAIDSLSLTSTTAQSVFIGAGTYTEQVSIRARKAKLTLYGETKDTTSYAGNTVTITHNSSLLSGAADNEHTATVMNRAENTAFYNINMINTYGKGSQALAISAWADTQGYYGCGLYGYQDTVLAQVGNQVFARCYIEGAVDFIFGQHARAWIDSCDIRVSAPIGAITANGRPSSSDVSYFVINKSKIAASSGPTATAGSVYLGRPWSQYARVVYQSTTMSDIIASAGWDIWTTSTPQTSNVLFGEYGNTGAGASGTRATFAQKLSASVSIAALLGSSYTTWVDSAYLA